MHECICIHMFWNKESTLKGSHRWKPNILCLAFDHVVCCSTYALNSFTSDLVHSKMHKMCYALSHRISVSVCQADPYGFQSITWFYDHLVFVISLMSLLTRSPTCPILTSCSRTKCWGCDDWQLRLHRAPSAKQKLFVTLETD